MLDDRLCNIPTMIQIQFVTCFPFFTWTNALNFAFKWLYNSWLLLIIGLLWSFGNNQIMPYLVSSSLLLSLCKVISPEHQHGQPLFGHPPAHRIPSPQPNLAPVHPRSLPPTSDQLVPVPAPGSPRDPRIHPAPLAHRRVRHGLPLQRRCSQTHL